jgi:hypothetical protein
MMGCNPTQRKSVAPQRLRDPQMPPANAPTRTRLGLQPAHLTSGTRRPNRFANDDEEFSAFLYSHLYDKNDQDEKSPPRPARAQEIGSSVLGKRSNDQRENPVAEVAIRAQAAQDGEADPNDVPLGYLDDIALRHFNRHAAATAGESTADLADGIEVLRQLFGATAAKLGSALVPWRKTYHVWRVVPVVEIFQGDNVEQVYLRRMVAGRDAILQAVPAHATYAFVSCSHGGTIHKVSAAHLADFLRSRAEQEIVSLAGYTVTPEA